MTNYPRDEFDAVPETSARHGVHRASLEVAPRSLMPLMIFGVAALCIGLLAFMIVPKLSGTTSGTPLPGVVHSTTKASATPSKLPAATAAPSTAAATTKAAVPTPTPTPTPTAVVDKTTPVAIFNGTGIGGLAANYTGTVTANGWTVSQAANWAGAPVATSVIFYEGAAQKANAQDLGKLLNITSLVDTTELGLPLAVVLGPGA
ncbi:MAG: LytR C-terminal domain-containing protein [Specibacter sp.]